MKSVVYVITSIIAIILIAISSMINLQFAIGLTLGTLFSIFNVVALTYGFKKMLADASKASINSLLSLIRVIVLLVFLFVIYKFSDLYGFIGFGIGNIIFIIALCIDEGRKMKRGYTE